MSPSSNMMAFPTLPGSPVKVDDAGSGQFREPGCSADAFTSSSISPSTSSTEPRTSLAHPRHSVASDLSCTTQDSNSSHGSSIASDFVGTQSTRRPVSSTTAATSRPSSIASNSSSSGFSQVQGQLAACPGLLSPSLASALGLGPQLGGSSASSSRNKDGQKPHRRVRAQSSHGPASSTRRPSLPIVPSMNHRMSVASISSFESLPEDDIISGFAAAGGVGGAPRSRHGSYDRNSSASRSAVSLCPQPFPSENSLSRSTETSPDKLQPFPTVNSPPSSPTKPSPRISISHERDSTDGRSSTSSARPSLLSRSATEPMQTTALVNMMSRRKMIATELLSTERSFVASLQLLDEEYYKPLMASLGRSRAGPASPSLTSSASTPILSRKSMGEIFSNFSDILQLSKELLSRLEERLERPGRPLASASTNPKDGGASSASARSWDPALDNVGDILVMLAPFMKMYSLYVKNFSSALQRIEAERKANEAFSNFIKDTEKRRLSREAGLNAAGNKQGFGYGLGFQAHLLTIVQRIPRYKLLVDDLIKNTPETHPDLLDLVKAGKMIEQVASYINENVRQHEMVLMMLSLQRSLQGLTEPLIVPGRSLIKRGTLMKTCRKNIQPREFFLFTDCIMYASPISGGIESASAAWIALAQRGGLYTGFQTEPVSTTSPVSPSEASNTIESVLPGPRSRTISGPEPFTPLAGAIFSLAGHQLQFRSKFMLRDCTVVSVEDHGGEGLHHCFEIRTPEKSFALYAETSISKYAWIQAIREARSDFLSARRTLKAEEDSIEARRDRRRSQYRLDFSKPSSRRLSLQNLTGALSGAPLSPVPHPISEAECEEGDAGVESTDAAIARKRTDSAPTSLRPPSFPSSATSISLAGLLTPSAAATPTRPLRVLEDYNAPVWVPDSRADKCACCSEQFGMWRRKHHCRLCGQVVCWSCSQRSFLIPSYQEGEEDRPARACDQCYDSVFPPDSPEASLAPLAFPQQPSSVDMSSEPSRGESVNSASSCGRLDSDASHGSPITPAGGQSPNLNANETAGSASPRSTATAKLGSDSTLQRAERPRSLRFDNLPPPLFPPVSAMEKKQEDDTVLMAAMLPPRSRSLVGSMLQMPERAGALEAKLFNASLSPQVQAATSGSGTFRLVTPRLTTPDAELPPGAANQRGSHGHALISASYFSGVNLDPSTVAEEGQGKPNPAGPSEPFKPSMIHGPNGIPAHLRPSQRKRPMSAAARLSTFYGAGLGMSSESRKKG